jgi:ArsR family transcriptional regulator
MTRTTITVFEDCCTPIAPAPLAAPEAEEMAGAIRVLGDPVRLQLVSTLAAVDEACVCDLVPSLGVSQPTVSHHLKVLHDVGLVEREQRGRWAFYRLRRAPLEALARALSLDRSSREATLRA